MPWSLTEIGGGFLNTTKLVWHYSNDFTSKATKNNAYSEVPKIVEFIVWKKTSDRTISSKPPPQCFKMCSDVSVEVDII